MNEKQHADILVALGEIETASKAWPDEVRYAVRALCRAVDFAVDPNPHMVCHELGKAVRNLRRD